MSETVELTAADLALASLLVLLNAGASLALRLGIGKRILIAAGRSVLQLSLLGVLLTWVFAREGPGLVVLLLVAMALLAGFEAVRRLSHRVRGIYPLTMGVMLVTSMAVAFYGTQVVVGVEPWYAPRYVIPILGMILGNSLNGISLGLETVLTGFRRERLTIELLLAHGATPREASRDLVQRSVRTGLIPILNAMVAAGVISIPGMMTGQILSGEPPREAAAYQVFILFCIAGGVALGTLGVVLGATRLVFDERHRLRAERVEPVG